VKQTDTESIVHILDDVTANKIAAGEVVERPASVVKELVENSLDAGADDIKIHLSDGGKRLIRVTDNGAGMSRADASIALKRHATSKISCAEDLFRIYSLGFRGEALPSIASVSHMEITTRRDADEAGTQVVSSGGVAESVTDAGSPAGTTISVGELFFNVPARQKFLKTPQTELGHVLNLINRFALSHPEVSITLSHNDRQVFKSSGSGRLEDAVLTVFGRDAAEGIMPVRGTMGPYKVRGFVSKPSYSKPNRSGQYFFVNRRYVKNRILIHALDEAYRGILPQGRFPLFIGFIETDPELVDVNVHPTKIEVRFIKEWDVHTLLAGAIRDALSSSSVAPDGSEFLPPAPVEREHGGIRYAPRHSAPETHSGVLDLEAFRSALAARMDLISEPGPAPSMPPPEQNLSPQEAMPQQSSDLLKDAVVLAQARNMYIVAQSPAGILLVDQHVAHERVLFDRLAAGGDSRHVQRLVIPVTLSLGRREALVLENKLEEMQSIGFEIEPFGKDTFAVRSVPAMVSSKNSEQVLRDIIEEMAENTSAKRLVIQREGVLAAAACKMSVKAGEHMSMEEMSALLADLAETSNPYLCPHGRPIVVCLSNRELDKMFGRL
jgi:DNA mismatch repair protein MutL